MKIVIAIIAAMLAFPVTAGFLYEGAFTAPITPKTGDALYSLYRYGYTKGSMGYTEDCFGNGDPSPQDGQPGCIVLFTQGKYAPNQLGAFDIPPPAMTDPADRTAANAVKLPTGQFIFDGIDPSTRANGSSIFQEIQDAGEIPKNRELTGIAILPDNRIMFACGYDWYNVSDAEHDSTCMATINNGVAVASGPFSFSVDGAPIELGTAMQLAEYMTYVDQDYADATFNANGSDWCLTGKQRSPGARTPYSQGTSLYAIPCGIMTSMPDGGVIQAIPLTHYPSMKLPAATTSSTAWPGEYTPYRYAPSTKSKGFTWGTYKGEKGVFVAVTQLGGSTWWYGTDKPWEDPAAHRSQCKFNGGNPVWGSNVYGKVAGSSCLTEWNLRGDPIPVGYIDPCGVNKGYHSVALTGPTWRSSVLFYKGSDLAVSAGLSMAGSFEHLNTLPFQIVDEFDNFPEQWSADCQETNGVLYEPKTGRMFVSERFKGRTVIHVFVSDSGDPIPDPDPTPPPPDPDPDPTPPPPDPVPTTDTVTDGPWKLYEGRSIMRDADGGEIIFGKRDKCVEHALTLRTIPRNTCRNIVTIDKGE
jgi:hypothetical protein